MEYIEDIEKINTKKKAINKNIESVVTNIAKQLFLEYIIEERRIWKRRIQKVSQQKDKKERDEIINREFPYLKEKTSFQNYILQKYRKENNATCNQYCKSVSKLLEQTLNFNDFINILVEKKIAIPKEDKKILKDHFIQELEKVFSCTPLSLTTMKMTLISSYKSLADIIIKDANIQDDIILTKIKNIFGKRIEDQYIDFTIPFASREKNKQMVEWLGAENAISFCCPDYKYYRDEERNLRCDTSIVGDEIGNFWEIFIKTAKKILPEIYTLWKLKTVNIIMPSYQIYLSPNETDYDSYCQKLLSTANKIKKELDNYFNEIKIDIEVICTLSNQLYSDQEIYQLKEKISPLVENYISNEFKDFYNKITGIEKNYRSENNEDKTKDILISDITEGQLLVEKLWKNTLYLLPEDEKMLRPQLVYMIQNQEIEKDIDNPMGWLATIIIQNTSMA